MNGQNTTDEARKFANGSHLGTSAHRELDRAILLIRDLLAMLDEPRPESDLPGFAEIMLDPEIGDRAMAIIAEHRTPPPAPTAEALAVTPKQPGIYLDSWGNTWSLHGDGVFMMSGFPRQDPTTYAPFTRLVPEHATGSTSDGHHTFDELYDYRMLYNAHAALGWLAAGIPVVKSWRHADGDLCFGGGWFVVTATLPTGQVSNHYQAEHWDLFAVPAVDLPPEYDGHTPAVAAERLRDAAREAALAGTVQGEPSSCSNPDCPLGRAHSGPCAPKGWQGAPRHTRACIDWYNHCQVCGTRIPYGSRCPAHYLNQQGEPSEVAVSAAGEVLYGISWGTDLADPDLVRAALRAAAATESKNGSES